MPTEAQTQESAAPAGEETVAAAAESEGEILANGTLEEVSARL